MDIVCVGGFDSQIMFKMLTEQGETLTALHFSGLGNSAAEQATFKKMGIKDPVIKDPDLQYPSGDLPGASGLINLTGRNTILAIQAAMLGAKNIFFGYVSEDMDTGIPDVSHKWINYVNLLLSIQFDGAVVRAPLVEMGLTKRDLYLWANKNKIKTDDLNSCYSGEPCGLCAKCFQRYAIGSLSLTDDQLLYHLQNTDYIGHEERILKQLGASSVVDAYQKFGL